MVDCQYCKSFNNIELCIKCCNSTCVDCRDVCDLCYNYVCTMQCSEYVTYKNAGLLLLVCTICDKFLFYDNDWAVSIKVFKHKRSYLFGNCDYYVIKYNKIIFVL